MAISVNMEEYPFGFSFVFFWRYCYSGKTPSIINKISFFKQGLPQTLTESLATVLYYYIGEHLLIGVTKHYIQVVLRSVQGIIYAHFTVDSLDEVFIYNINFRSGLR